MGVIGSSTMDIHGVETRTEVHTNRFEEFVIKLAKRFSHKHMWRVIHWIEKRKLAKQ
jgi:hypothetical protein